MGGGSFISRMGGWMNEDCSSSHTSRRANVACP